MVMIRMLKKVLTHTISRFAITLVIASPALCMDVSGVRLGIHEDKTRLVIDLTHEAQFKIIKTDSPKKFQIQLRNTRVPQKFASKQKGKGHIAGFYFTRGPQKTMILTIDAKGAAEIQKAFAMTKASDGPYRLVVDIRPKKNHSPPQKPAQKENLGKKEQPDSIILPAKDTNLEPLKPNKQHTESVINNRMNSIPLPFIKPLRRVVVIDAGHGGQDPGTISPQGVHEKDITLAVAIEMKRLIDKSGKYAAVLTRTKDQHLPLRYRFSVARELNANLLISLHADSNPNKKVKGVSVYTLSEKASDKEAERLADKENNSDFLEDLKFAHQEEKDVKDILINLSQTRAKNHAIQFADMLMKRFSKQEVLAKNKHRAADFAVLKAPDVASVLIELGYLSNVDDQKRLVSRSYQRKIASQIVTAIDDYFEHIKS
jgi:N-acetylmuramoyl-L-alanine amidase